MECDIHCNIWGKRGSKSLAARLWANQTPSSHVVDNKPYAELWLGTTHPNGMSEVVLPPSAEKGSSYTMPLLDFIQCNPKVHLGKKIFGEENDLTFLFKVLSIEKTLAIQAHPDKALAAKLHRDRPKIYSDANHKPEMALAISDDFEALVGFRPMSELAANVENYPEFFTNLVMMKATDLAIASSADGSLDKGSKAILKKLMSKYMFAQQDLIEMQLNCMLERLTSMEHLSSTDKLILKLADQYPGDAGVFAPILFNHLKLKRGEAIFIDANEPHAYIQGDILECMAASDNVVRAGLSNKYKDKETLVNMLTYRITIPKPMKTKQLNQYSTLYIPPVEDFAMEVLQIPPRFKIILQKLQSATVLLTLEGTAVLQQGNALSMSVSFGKTVFMSANTDAAVITDENSPGVTIVRASSNVYFAND